MSRPWSRRSTGCARRWSAPLTGSPPARSCAIVSETMTGERAEVRSSGDGVVVLARRGARVARGDNLVVLAQPETEVA